MKRKLLYILLPFSLILVLSGSSVLHSQNLIYTPKNPAFGGNPINYQWLLSSAQQQNKFTGQDADRFRRDPLEDFQNSLQRQVLSQLTRDIVSDRFGADGQPTEESRFEFGEFTIDVTPGPDGVQIRIFNILTGDETSITIPNF